MHTPYSYKQHSHRQKGAVLIVSLLILLVLTVIGVSGLSNTSLEERMASSFQHSTLAYQGAESALENIWKLSTNGTPFYSDATNPLLTAFNAGLNNPTTIVSYSPGSNLYNADLNTSTTVVFLSTGNCAQDTYNLFTCINEEARAQASITATSTSVRHIQGYAIKMPGADGRIN